MSLKPTAAISTETDHDYQQFEDLIRSRVVAADQPLFATNAEGLFDVYLAHLREGEQQHYRCHACRRFLDKYGGLVTISEDGITETVLWSPVGVPAFFWDANHALYATVERAKVTGVFYDPSPTWGTPKTGDWTHLSGTPKKVFTHALQTASQAAAEKTQDYIMLKTALSEIPPEAVVQAVRVLEADAVDRSEKTLGVAKWFLALHAGVAGRKGPLRDNIVWRAVATAPPGWCHIRSTMISTLLDDVIAGLPFESIKARWNEKMHPLQYQRPTTLKEGAVKAANEAVEKLGTAGALARRFARQSDILAAVWKPAPLSPPGTPPEPPKGGAFDHLLPKNTIQEVQLPPQPIGWDKFRDTILPAAAEVEVLVPAHGPFYGLVTAADPAAPPILQWDGLTARVEYETDPPRVVGGPLPRNPVSWYFYHGGSPAAQWGLTPGWLPVGRIHLKPAHWQKPDQFAHQGRDVFFNLPGARDAGHQRGGGFFPECLRSEYHGIRAAMEAHAKQATIAGREEGDANGIALSGNALRVRVTGAAGGRQVYQLTL